MNFTPTADRVLVRRLKHSNRVGRFFLADSEVPTSQECVVEAVGFGGKDKKGNRKPIPLAVGDRILIGKYDYQKIVLDDEEKLLVQEEKVVGRVVKEGGKWLLRPLNNRIVGKVINPTTSSLIILPELAVAPSLKAVVLAVAADVDVEPGEIVHFAENYGTRVSVGGDELVIIPADAPIAIEAQAMAAT